MLLDVLQVLLLTAIAVELGLLVRRPPVTVRDVVMDPLASARPFFDDLRRQLGEIVKLVKTPATVPTADTTALTVALASVEQKLTDLAAAEMPPLIPENTTHQWGPRLPRPPKSIRPAPSPRGNCAFLVKRADNGVLVGSRPPGHPDETEALANPRLSVEYLHEGGV